MGADVGSSQLYWDCKRSAVPVHALGCIEWWPTCTGADRLWFMCVLCLVQSRVHCIWRNGRVDCIQSRAKKMYTAQVLHVTQTCLASRSANRVKECKECINTVDIISSTPPRSMFLNAGHCHLRFSSIHTPLHHPIRRSHDATSNRGLYFAAALANSSFFSFQSTNAL